MTVERKRSKEKYEDLLGEYVIVGVPHQIYPDKLFFHYGTFRRISSKYYVIKPRNQPLLAIEKEKVQFIRKARRPRGW